MQVSAPSSSLAPTQTGSLIQLLRSAQQMQEELAKELLTVQIENQVAAQKMEIAGQIIDAYA